MNTQRQTIYGKRQEVLEGHDLKPLILDMCEEVVNGIVGSRWVKNEPDREGLSHELQARFATPFEPAELPRAEDPAVVSEHVMGRLEARYAERETQLGSERMRMIERFL